MPVVLLVLLLLSLPTAAVAESQRVVLDDGLVHVLSSGSPWHRQPVAIEVREGTTVHVIDFSLPGSLEIGHGGRAEIIGGESWIHTLTVTGDGQVHAPKARLAVVRLIARDAALVDGPALDLELPPYPDPEQDPGGFERWIEEREAAPPYLIAQDAARITLDEIHEDPIAIQSILSGDAEVTALGSVRWPHLDMHGSSSFSSTDAWVEADLRDTSRLEIAGATWSNIDVRDDAFARIADAGASTAGFALRFHDRAGGFLERANDGGIWHGSSGVLTVVDSEAPTFPDGQRELRIFLQNADARLILENFGGPYSLNAPPCGAPCNPFYLVVGAGKYVRAVDSVFHLEARSVRWLELENSVALSLYPNAGSSSPNPPIRGHCVRLAGNSAAGFGHEGQCARLNVSVLSAGAGPVAGATLTLTDAVTGEPVLAYDAATGTESATRTTAADGTATFDLAPRGRPLKMRVQGEGFDTTADVLMIRDEHSVTVR